MIYADPSFLCSLYGWDGNTRTAQATFERDARQPLRYTPWQRLEVRNAIWDDTASLAEEISVSEVPPRPPRHQGTPAA